ncbi:putative mitochondrion biogenesis protein (She9) [Aspergillus puulaauensis]|uniref:Sensitive to high expression protein 9, mitochondrial n=1 Tax=Aspergillus puulaauensis TaxID=1220207 RepID=A0A7R7XGI1_9EURO|nr:sensitivity to high expression protein she9 [Aspergillus puulaauensis]BCS20219.1 sensitivity to high expression protein she9 [Aspergillus puulaauensis]
MQSMPWLLRQSIWTGINTSRTSLPVRSPVSPFPLPKSFRYTGNTRRDFSVCLRCQFRSQPALFSDEIKRSTDGKPEEKSRDVGNPLATPDGSREGETDAGAQGTPQAADTVHTQGQEGKGKVDTSRSESGGLPSYLEDRRSQFSKQFSTVMDNVQSNVFVAGQRLNDLTGYSSIEALKRSIHEQEDRLRTARVKVRTAKEAYAAAINRRSTSQREVNELLQRKHAWSSADLERFTLLYRNDHTNEVSENETQEALSAAERESEEAAAQLTKNILSRYHEEQVWSDKIRRMSTWGTWGLMGVNVLLFLIFQIGVEPWRRKRLVKGFEEKVLEAIEKEKVLAHTQPLPSAEASVATTGAVASASDTSSSTSNLALEAPSDVTVGSTVTKTKPEERPTENAVTDTFESFHPHPLQFPPSNTVESWRQYAHDLFGERTVSIAHRDLSIIAATSAAAGAAVMSIVLALARSR